VLFVGGISSDTTQDEIRKAFCVYGTVSKVEIKDSFAYVYMTSGGTRAHDEMDGTRLGSGQRRIRVEWARNVAHGRSEPSTPNSTLYVADYDPRMHPDELRALFEEYGKVVRISPCKKFTFVEFEKLEDAIRAHNEMPNKTVGSRTLTVQYARPEPHRNSVLPPADASAAPAAPSSSTKESTDAAAVAPAAPIATDSTSSSVTA